MFLGVNFFMSEVNLSNLFETLDRYHALRATCDRGEEVVEIRQSVEYFCRANLSKYFPKNVVLSEAERFDVGNRVLQRLLQAPIASTVEWPAAYLRMMVRNRAMDIFRENAVVSASFSEYEGLNPTWEDESCSPERRAILKERLAFAVKSLAVLAIEDRIVLKLLLGLAELTRDELGWLSDRSGVDAADLRAQLSTLRPCAKETAALVAAWLYPEQPDAAKRADALRQRRNRARTEFLKILERSDS